MNINNIRENLKTTYIGKNIIYFDITESTQEKAKELVIKNIQNGTVIIADMQTNGKGTHGRAWLTEPNKNILMTLVIYPNCNILELEGITIKIANCLLDVIWDLYKIELDIKEPNDIILNNKKIGGILTETKVEGEFVRNLFIGIGLNINQEEFPEQIKNIATSLKKEIKKFFSREEIITCFLNKFEKILNI